jgi:hypothetical protein
MFNMGAYSTVCRDFAAREPCGRRGNTLAHPGDLATGVLLFAGAVPAKTLTQQALSRVFVIPALIPDSLLSTTKLPLRKPVFAEVAAA